jgi:outer membrane receptor protein involved in Fe transport
LVGFDLIQPVNSLGLSEVRGIELDLQVNLSTLPKPFNGFVLSANATFIQSETFFTEPEVVFNPNRIINVPFETRFPGQPNQTYNFSIGYERKGFSSRFSIIHQADNFGLGGENEGDRIGGLRPEIQNDDQLNPSVGKTTRLDLSVSQKVYKNFLIIFNANNITNQLETLFNAFGETRREEFGLTLDLGFQYKF